MTSNSRILKKSYAMQRMARAIDRAVLASTGKDKERAARWVGAWGMLCGIRSETVRLRRSDVAERSRDRVSEPLGQIEIAVETAAFSATAGLGHSAIPGNPATLPMPAATSLSDPASPA